MDIQWTCCAATASNEWLKLRLLSTESPSKQPNKNKITQSNKSQVCMKYKYSTNHINHSNNILGLSASNKPTDSKLKLHTLEWSKFTNHILMIYRILPYMHPMPDSLWEMALFFFIFIHINLDNTHRPYIYILILLSKFHTISNLLSQRLL